jgi:hypothetical protein
MAGEMVTDFPDKKVKIHFLAYWINLLFLSIVASSNLQVEKGFTQQKYGGSYI